MMKRGDMWLIGIIAVIVSVISITMFQTQSAADDYDGRKYARITVDREHYRTVELSNQEQTIELQTKYGHNVLLIQDGGIRMLEADCPDDLCLLMGTKERIGEMIVCLPNRILVEIIGEHGEEAEVDAIVT